MFLHTKYSILSILFLIFCMASNTYSGTDLQHNKQSKELIFGVFPYLTPRLVEKMYSPIGHEFSKVLGQKVRFLTSSSYEKFVVNLDKQIYDIVFVQPFDYVKIADKYGYKPLAVRNEELRAILVVIPTSPIQKLSDLKGKTIGLPPKIAAISYLTNRYLRNKGFTPGKDIKVKYFRSHFSCLHNVLIGSVAACGTAPPAMRVFNNRMNRELRIFAKTKPISNALFAVHPRVSDTTIKLLKNAITQLHRHTTGRKILEATKTNAFVEIKNSQYDEVRSMAKTFR
ncbi:hypothetical protein MNBD_GAMMA12-1860 [hydrothermal vent metagenome]|uniref:Uncharacterized protein n=1 Tax=hydrothermal vent metagenome TaxID=652676 RepID=A0A3B0Z4J6_9ZZZZ